MTVAELCKEFPEVYMAVYMIGYKASMRDTNPTEYACGKEDVANLEGVPVCGRCGEEAIVSLAGVPICEECWDACIEAAELEKDNE